MTNAPYIRSVLAHAAFELMSPSIRKSLLEGREFCDEYGFSADAVLALGDSGISFQRSELFNAVRRLFTDAAAIDIRETDGRAWKLKLESKAEELPIITISSSDQRLVLSDLSVLSPDSGVRLRSLAETASDVNLPATAVQAWHSILSCRALEDDEVDGFHGDFRLTPVRTVRSIRAEIEKNESRVSSFVPLSRTYYERLVGVYDGDQSIRDYAVGTGKKFFEGLSAWRPYDGFLLSLLLSSHSALTSEINPECLDAQDFVHAFGFLEKYEDRISQLGAIEVGLRVLPVRPEIEPYLIRLIEQILDDDAESPTSNFKLLSALFVFVDGELARTRVLSDTPPFYRRLAALSQAALIHRQAVSSPIHIDSFCELVLKNCGEYFYFQSFVDMRLEPRWGSELSTASQIKANFCSRIMFAAKKYEKNIAGSKLHNLILKDEVGTFHSLSESFHLYFPGPLEGEESGPSDLPVDLAEAVEAQVTAEEVGPSSFIALVNSAMIFRVEEKQAELAAKALKLGSHRLTNIEDRPQLLAILNGLATVAAASRGQSLADELRILVRRYRRDTEYALSIDEALRICLVAAASRSDLNAWREFVGDWITELAFDDFKDNEAIAFHSNLQRLCHVVPELWISCGRADAALAAYNAVEPVSLTS